MNTTTMIKLLLLVCTLIGVYACKQEEALQQHTTQPVVALYEEEGGEVVNFSSDAILLQSEEDMRGFPYLFTQAKTSGRAGNVVREYSSTLDYSSLPDQIEVVAVLRNLRWSADHASLVFPLQWNKASNTFTVQQQITLPVGRGTSKWGTEGWRLLLFAGGVFDRETGVYRNTVPETLLIMNHRAATKTATLETIYVNAASGNAQDPWIPIAVTTEGTTTRFSASGVRMEPQGAVVMLQLKNETPTGGVQKSTLSLRGYSVQSNMASLRASYSLYNLSTSQAPKYEGSEGGFAASFLFPNNAVEPVTNATADPDELQRYSRPRMLQIYPLESAPATKSFSVTAHFYSKLVVDGLHAGNSPVVAITATTTNKFPVSKRSYIALIEASERDTGTAAKKASSLKHPIQTLLVDDDGWAKTYGPGRFSSTANKDVYQAGRNYYMPTDNQLRVLLPGMHGGLRPGGQLTNPIIRFGEGFVSDTKFTGEVEGTIQAFEDLRGYHGEYRNNGQDISYGMRFLNHQNMQWRSAYRYERKWNSKGEVYLNIKVYHLGKDVLPNDGIDQIANEAWWNNNKNNTAILGIYERNIPAGQYWSSSGMPAMPRKKAVLRVFYREEEEMGYRGHGAFVTDYNAFRQWAEVQDNVDTKTLLFTVQKDLDL